MSKIRYAVFMTLWFVIGGVVVFFAIQNLFHPQLRHNHLIDRLTHPFDTRVRYRLGDIDERFGISRHELKSLSEQATQIWHDGTGKQWFVYDESAQLTIHLIYDERQATTLAKQNAEHTISRMITSHQQTAHTIDTQRQKLRQEFDALQTQIQHWQNAHQNILYALNHTDDPIQYQKLNQERQKLQKHKQALDTQISQYHKKQTAFNQLVDDFNRQAQTINNTIDQSSQLFEPRKFDKGVFDGRQIRIYEFGSPEDLTLTLAHELGHALGIGHNDDPTALMYPYAQNQDVQNFRLKPADIDLLNNR